MIHIIMQLGRCVIGHEVGKLTYFLIGKSLLGKVIWLTIVIKTCIATKHEIPVIGIKCNHQCIRPAAILLTGLVQKYSTNLVVNNTIPKKGQISIHLIGGNNHFEHAFCFCCNML